MNKELITKIQDMIDSFNDDTISSATLASEGYPHGSYISSLGTTTDDMIYLFDDINHLLGNPISISQALFDVVPFYECIYYLTKDTKSPLDLKLKKIDQSYVVHEVGTKLICQIWQHKSGRFIQVIFNNETLETASACEVIQKYNSINKLTYYEQKGIK